MGKMTITITYPADAHTPAAVARDRIEKAAIAEARRCAAPSIIADAMWLGTPPWTQVDHANVNARHGGLLRKQTVRRAARRIWTDNARRIQVCMTRDRRAKYDLSARFLDLLRKREGVR